MQFFILTLLAFLTLTAPPATAKQTIQLTDLSGREVRISVPVEHVILGEGRYLPTLGILDQDNPAKRVVGMMGDFEKYDPATYAQYVKHFPEIANIARIGSNGEVSFSIEKAFSVKPDVALFGMGSGHGPNDKSATVIQQLEAAGIPVVILDFRIEPLKNTPKSMKILGKLFDKEEQANAFLSFYTDHMDRVKDRLKDIKDRPRVFMESHVGMMPQCCRAFGQQMMGRFIKWAGGKNAFGEMIPGTVAQVSTEHLIINQPDIYIGTAIGSKQTQADFPNLIALGTGTDEETAQTTLENSLGRTGVAQLDAVKNAQAHTIWHHFYNTPMHVAAIEAMAQWFHPDLFGDLDPRATLQTYFDRFQPVPLDGVYWTSRTHKGTP